jgi:hypothetical protein
LIEDVVEKFQLTSDHERAFRIIVNHAVTPGSEQLMTYVGGMGGTEKLQVIKTFAYTFHDGMTTGSSCENEGDFNKFSSRDLLKCKVKTLFLVIYARV